MKKRAARGSRLGVLVAFHVEIRRGFSRAWAFNLAEGELRRAVLDPWAAGAMVQLGDQLWEPARCRLTVLQGPPLAPAELAHGQGWNRAQRTARDVTRDLPTAAAAVVALVTHDDAGRRVAGEALNALGLAAVEFAPVRARLLARPPLAAGVAAAIVVAGPGPRGPDWAVDAGLALGALGARALVACLDDAPAPAELAGVAAVRLPPGPLDAARALAEPLRAAGRIAA
jgi:hypothetical protein